MQRQSSQSAASLARVPASSAVAIAIWRAAGNPLERVNREINRRADVLGIFPNDSAIIVSGACAAPLGPGSPFTVGALMLETDDEWTVARRYMSPETLARITDTPTVRLPAVAT